MNSALSVGVGNSGLSTAKSTVSVADSFCRIVKETEMRLLLENHEEGDLDCVFCHDLPEPCKCGGVIHKEESELDPDTNEGSLVYECDQCSDEWTFEE